MKLKKENIFTQSLVKELPGMAYRCKNDQFWTMESVSEGCKELTEYRPEDLISNRKLAYTSIIHPDDRKLVKDTIEKSIKKLGKFEVEYRIITASGKVKWVLEKGHAFPLKKGRAGKLEGFILGITHYKEALRKIESLEKRYEIFIKNSECINFQGDLDFKPLFFHGNIENITRYSKTYFTKTGNSWLDIVHPEDKSILKKDIDNLRNIPDYSTEREYRIIAKNNKIRWVKEIIQNVSENNRPYMVQGTIIDITKNKLDEFKINNLNSILNIIRNVNQLIVFEQNRSELINKVCKTITSTKNFPYSCIILFNGKNTVSDYAESNIDKKAFNTFISRINTGKAPFCINKAIKERDLITITNEDSGKDCPLLKYHPKTSLITPLEYSGRVTGILYVSSKYNMGINQQEKDLIKEAGNDLAFALHKMEIDEERTEFKKDLSKSYRRLKKTYQQFINMLATLIEIRDPYTHGHQERVSALVEKMARKSGYPIKEINNLIQTSMLHDIGKIFVPASILSKPGRLTQIEFSMLKEHPGNAFTLLKNIDFDFPIAEIILQHHERLDGSGYPNSLKGEEILKEARLLAIADVVEAMSSHRPYRPALGIENALEEINANKETLFDPGMVEICIEIFTEDNFRFPE